MARLPDFEGLVIFAKLVELRVVAVRRPPLSEIAEIGQLCAAPIEWWSKTDSRRMGFDGPRTHLP
jgi:hypothetical protein